MRMRIGLAAMALLAASGCGYNRMVELREGVESAWAQVDSQLQRRNDLLPNLVETTRGYAAHEKDVFSAVANARARLLSSSSRDDRMDASTELSGAIGRLLVLGESYPDLKANQQFGRLSDELAGTENRIAVERMRYNEAVRTYNAFIQSFPHVVYASAAGFHPLKYFDAPASAEQVPKVDFGTPAPPHCRFRPADPRRRGRRRRRLLRRAARPRRARRHLRCPWREPGGAPHAGPLGTPCHRDLAAPDGERGGGLRRRRAAGPDPGLRQIPCHG